MISVFANLGQLDKAWDGWRIEGDRLWADTGVVFKIDEIRCLELLWKRLAELKDENERLKGVKERRSLVPCRRRHDG